MRFEPRTDDLQPDPLLALGLHLRARLDRFQREQHGVLLDLAAFRHVDLAQDAAFEMLHRLAAESGLTVPGAIAALASGARLAQVPRLPNMSTPPAMLSSSVGISRRRSLPTELA